MEIENEGIEQIEIARVKNKYQAPKLVEQGQWTEKTLPPISGTV